MEPLIELIDIKFSYPERGVVLDKVNFSLYKGERIGIKGANGSGKTTLLYLMVGLIKPEKGKIKIFGKEMKKEDDFVEVRKKIGFLFQDPDDQLFSPTVEEDIAFGPLNLRIEKKKIEEIVEKIIKTFGIENLRKRFSHTLSYGEKRLVSIATVLSMEPEILLMDEPTTALDEETTKKIEDFLLSSKNLSYCIVSHDFSFIKNVCNKIYILKDGKLT